MIDRRTSEETAKATSDSNAVRLFHGKAWLFLLKNADAKQCVWHR